MHDRTDLWRVWVNGRPASRPIWLPASHGTLTPMAMAENLAGTVPSCNRFAYRFQQVALAGTPGGSSQVALELEYDPGYFRFDPADMRGGDTAGRSTASVTVTPGPTSTTFSITAVTPDRSDGTDRDPVHLDMTVTCPT